MRRFDHFPFAFYGIMSVELISKSKHFHQTRRSKNPADDTSRVGKGLTCELKKTCVVRYGIFVGFSDCSSYIKRTSKPVST